MVWTTPAIDPKRGLLIFSTGNPNPDLNGDARKGDNLWTDSIVALDVNSGKLKWAYQEVKHDVWDYDAVSNVVLFDVHENGKTIPAAGEAGKVGWFFIVNRETGKLIRKSEPFVPMSKNMFTTPTKEGVRDAAGRQWRRGMVAAGLFAEDARRLHHGAQPAHDLHHLGARPTFPGTIRLGSTFANVKGDKAQQSGTFTAINVDNGKVDWQAKAPQPMMGGVLATAGNLVFTGEGNGWFDAFNAKTGKKLWRYNLGAGVNAPPITYEVTASNMWRWPPAATSSSIIRAATSSPSSRSIRRSANGTSGVIGAERLVARGSSGHGALAPLPTLLADRQTKSPGQNPGDHAF